MLIFLIQINAQPLRLGLAFRLSLSYLFIGPRLDNERIGHQLPDVFHLVGVVGADLFDLILRILVDAGLHPHTAPIGPAAAFGYDHLFNEVFPHITYGVSDPSMPGVPVIGQPLVDVPQVK